MIEENEGIWLPEETDYDLRRRIIDEQRQSAKTIKPKKEVMRKTPPIRYKILIDPSDFSVAMRGLGRRGVR